MIDHALTIAAKDLRLACGNRPGPVQAVLLGLLLVLYSACRLGPVSIFPPSRSWPSSGCAARLVV